MSSRIRTILALSAVLPFALSACETSGSGDLLEDASASIQPSVPPEQFQFTSPTQVKYNPFTVDMTQPSSASGGPPKSFVRVSSPGISIGSPQHEAVARAVVVEAASERLCQPGTVPQFQQQYGHDVYLNERVQKWGAIVYCDSAPAFSPQNGPAMASAAYSDQGQAPVSVRNPTSGQTPGVFGSSNTGSIGSPMPSAPVQDTVMPLPNDNQPLPLSMMSSDGFQ